MKKVFLRIGSNIALLLIVLYAPWWVAFVSLLLFAFLVERPVEVIIHLLLRFALFAVPQIMSFWQKLYFVAGVLVLYGVILLIKTRMKSRYEARVYYKDY